MAWGGSINGGAAARRVFVSYAHDSETHKRAVARLVVLLRERGIDVHYDEDAVGVRKSWSEWAEAEIRRADAVVVVGSPQCRAGTSTGIRTELAVLRELLAEDYDAALVRVLPVLLSGATPDDIPGFLRPRDADHYPVDVNSGAGIDGLVRALHAQVDVARREILRAEPPPAAAGRANRRGPVRTVGAVLTIAVSGLVVTGIDAALRDPAAVAPRTGGARPGLTAELPAGRADIFGDKRCSAPASPRPAAERIAITAPAPGATIGTPEPDGVLAHELVRGTAEVAAGESVWLFFYATSECLYYVLGTAETAAGRWEAEITVAARQTGRFVLHAMVVGAEDTRRIDSVVSEAGDTPPFLERLPPKGRAAYVPLVCCRAKAAVPSG